MNWLYRPAEIKLGKGALVEGAPNEVFYSFHEDLIPAASLLHPCKVAFLPKSVGLPAKTSSFVCRRVYDITNRCLWWLTDKDYTNDRQEEVDQLLYKTRVEMHVPSHPGGRSPKQVNGPTSSSQVKSVPDSGIASHSQMKGKKRERGDHSGEQVKRERCSRSDENDSNQSKTESIVMSEIARITDRGGLVDLEGVETLVHLMQLDKNETKPDLVNRSIFAGVVAATEKADCLDRFMQLRGLPVFDEWLQDVQKGKIGDGNGLRDSNVSIDEFLLVLLGALDKLPVDLRALQLCYIGRSVNHLRSHKNIEIQRKARSLVDTWKKRVEAEMITNEAKSHSTQSASVWPSKSQVTEASHSGGKTPTVSDAAIKSSITHSSASKSISARSSHVDSNIKTSSPGHIKPASSPSSVKESSLRLPVGGSSDASVVREDRSSSSNQSHSQSQFSPGKEEAKSSVAGSATVDKILTTGSRSRKNSSFPVSSEMRAQKELIAATVSSVSRNTSLEKLNSSVSSVEIVSNVPASEESSHKLIVKVPDRVCSPAQGVAGISQVDSTYTCSQVSSPVLIDKNEQFERTSGKTDVHPSNTDVMDTWKDNDRKGTLTVSAEPAVLPPAVPDEVESMTAVTKKSNQGNLSIPMKSSKLSSFSPMCALMNCVKYSEANSSLSVDDDVGMNLLASVAAGEISKSELLSPTESTERSMHVPENICHDDEAKSKPVSENNIQFSHDAEGDNKKQAAIDDSSLAQEGLPTAKDTNDLLSDKKVDSLGASEEMAISDNNNNYESLNTNSRSKEEPKLENVGKSNENATSVSRPISVEENHKEKNTPCISNVKIGGIEEPNIEALASHSCTGYEGKKDAIENVNRTAYSDKPLSVAGNEDYFKPPTNGADNGASIAARSNFDIEVDNDNIASGEVHRATGVCFPASEATNHEKDVSMESKKNLDNCSVAENLHPAKGEMPLKSEFGVSDSASIQGNDREKCPEAPISVEASSSSSRPEKDAKIEFDLNEGFNADEGKYAEPASFMSSGPPAVHMMSSLPFSVSPIPNYTRSGHSTSITVAAAARGPFFPPDDLLKSKREIGWRGSAATSAFRPAEPRKILETPLVSTSLPMSDASSSKHGRITFDIDLNVPDERVLEEMAPRNAFDVKTSFTIDHTKLLAEPSTSMSGSFRESGFLDFDLNRMDDASETGNCSTSNHHKREISSVNLKPFDGFLAADARRDLDLNNNHGVVDINADHFSSHQQVKVGAAPPQFSTPGLKMNSPGQGSFASWFPPGTSYSAVAIPSMLPDRGEHPFPVFPSSAAQRAFAPSGVTSFAPEIYRGSVLSSSPAMPFPTSTFQFPLFPFGATYPLPSATFPVGATSYVDSSSGQRLFAPPGHPHLPGPVFSVAPHFQRPFMAPLPDSSNSGASESTRRWGRQDFDLNAGPGATEAEVREEIFPVSSAQNSVSSSHALTEEQARMYTASSGVMKRKDPEGGWDSESFRFKQSSWQ